jgi:hypothetical protein
MVYVKAKLLLYLLRLLMGWGCDRRQGTERKPSYIQ